MFQARFEREAAGYDNHGGQYEDHTTDVCLDDEFILKKRPSALDGGQYPCPAPLLRQTDRSGIERNAADGGQSAGPRLVVGGILFPEPRAIV